MPKLLPIIAILGPTGVGKTALSIALAKRYQAEIINADSMQVYQGLNIGTAKIKEEEKEGIPHYLFDLCSLDEHYTVYHYQKDCRRLIDQIRKRGKNVIMVGGTGLYLKAALYDYRFLDRIEKKNYDEFTNEELYNKVKQLDPNYHEHLNNRQRLVSTLNRLEDQSYSSIKEKPLAIDPLYPVMFLGLTTTREELYQRIDQRVDQMIKNGLKEEVLPLYQLDPIPKAVLSGIGYKEWKYLVEGMLNENQVVELIKKNSRHYAKRQYTFFHHQFPVQWFNTNYENFESTIFDVSSWIDKENSKQN